ncbi:MAG: RdgB/HAM1 family non-canonical purine NTP pyrophosphatase [Pyrinomonadaceae bacterium]
MQILAGTKNAGKIRELKELLAGLPINLQSLNEFENIVEPEETGATFAENAALKAVYYARETGLAALADDSGLEVEALNNAPGVYSARYAGATASDAEKISKLLNEIKTVKEENRSARFVCAIALTDKSGEIIFQTEGICRGKIASAPAGKNGFGYDPVFIPEGFDETFGELSGAIKSNLSHRARAIEKIIQFLRDLQAV